MESNVLGLQDWWLQGPERQVEVEHLRLIGKWVRQKASSLQVLEQLSTQRERERGNQGATWDFGPSNISILSGNGSKAIVILIAFCYY